MRFKDKTALVTGAGSGIGRASAIRLAEEGAALALADINGDAIEMLAEKIRREHDVNVACFQFDATSTSSCRAMVDAAAAHFGVIDILCNIAGIAGGWHFHQMPEAAWDRMVAINQTSVFVICQQAIPHLVKSKGNIVNMASASAKQGQPYTTAYCATKAAVVALTRCLAVEYAKDGVRANAICPGGVNTPINQTLNFPTDIDARLMDKLYPLFPMAEPEEIAAAVAYLASSEARYVTGTDFSIDGGQTMS